MTARLRLGISECLLGRPVRHDGSHKHGCRPLPRPSGPGRVRPGTSFPAPDSGGRESAATAGTRRWAMRAMTKKTAVPVPALEGITSGESNTALGDEIPTGFECP